MKTKLKRAVFPGSFDPFTYGHLNIVERAAELFDEVLVAVSDSGSKKYLLSHAQRLELAKSELRGLKNVRVESNKGLTVDFAKKAGAKFLIRSLRSGADLDHEKSIAEANRKLWNKVDTVFLIADPSLACVSSTLVREIAKVGGELKGFVSKEAEKALRKALSGSNERKVLK